ncbi:MAG: BrnT family toxin [Alphaproteobacteria bacterium]|nr:BrnT family toxin [Alphaproteobacteria bacterium]
MFFDYDAAKSLQNKQKYGIDFEYVQQLWNDVRYVEAQAKAVGEPRFMAIGTINGKCWSVIIAKRGNKTRIISARRSREEEIELYEDIGI